MPAGVPVVLACATIVASADTLPATPSAIGAAWVRAIVASPGFAHTAFAVAVAQDAGCSSDCVHLWATHDGGATWGRAAAQGWGQNMPTVVSDHAGNDVLVAAAQAGVQESDDGGASWRTVGPPGFPTASPLFAGDDLLAVVGGGSSDYVLQHGSRRDVPGAHGAMTESGFAVSPTYPDAGGFAPVLIAGARQAGNTVIPMVATCTADFNCGSPVQVGPAGAYTFPVVLSFSSDYRDDGTVFAQTPSAIYKSSNGGKSFGPVTVGQPGAVSSATPALAVATDYRERGPARAWAALMQAFRPASPTAPPGATPIPPAQEYTAGGIMATSDGGGSWHALGSPGHFDKGALAVAATTTGRLFAAYAEDPAHAGLLCSADGGATWAAACPAMASDRAASGAVRASPGIASACNSVSCAKASNAPAGTTPGAGAAPSHSGGNAGGLPAGGVGAALAPHGGASASPGVVVAVPLAVVAAGGWWWLRRRRTVGGDRR